MQILTAVLCIAAFGLLFAGWIKFTCGGQS